MHLSRSINNHLSLQVEGENEKQTHYALISGRKSSALKKGFTLVEVLVVMAIIATLLGVGVGGIKSMASSKGVSTAVPLAEGLFRHARQLAKSTGEDSYVVIYADVTGDKQTVRDNYLRAMGVAQASSTGSGGALRLVSRPVFLPSKVYFNIDLSNQDDVRGRAIFPGSPKPKKCYVYGFNSEGNMLDGELRLDARFVVQAGKLRPGSKPVMEDGVMTSYVAPVLVADSKNSRDLGGFKIWPNGRMAKFRSPNQIIKESEDAEF